MKCRSGQHEWTRPEDAAKCCNGYHRELRIWPDMPSRQEQLDGATGIPGLEVQAWNVWVKDGCDRVSQEFELQIETG